MVVQDLKNVGEIEKIRIGHDNDGAFADWCLEEVQARDGEREKRETPRCRLRPPLQRIRAEVT